MSFFFIKTQKEELLNKASNHFKEHFVVRKKDALLFYDKKNEFYSDSKNLLSFEGRLICENIDRDACKKKFIDKIINNSWPLDDSFSGYFSGIIFNEKEVYILNDPVGIFHLFYYIKNETLIVSTNLYSIYSVLDHKINLSAVVLETISPFIQYGTMTILQDVKRLLPGELIKVGKEVSIEHVKYDTTIKKEDRKPEKKFAEKLVDLINKEIGLMYGKQDEEVILSLSGGIDSRINLAGLIYNNIPFKAIHYGIKGTLETKIALKLAEKFDFPIEIINPRPYLFPAGKIVENIIKETDSLFVNMWHGIILREDNDFNKVFLLGDMLDILRAKGIKSFKTRDFRTKFYINKFIKGTRLPLVGFSNELAYQFCENKFKEINYKVKKQLENFQISSREKKEILNLISNDFFVICQHLKRYNFASIQSFEEFFNIFTSGRLVMGKQLNLLRFKYRAEIPLSSLKILRNVLNISPEYRYADELTHKMFKVSKWKKIGQVPTNQNPFFSYNSPFPIMLAGWFFRSKTDYLFTKLFLKSKGLWKKKRLYRFYDFSQDYKFPQARENYISYFDKQEIFKPDYLIEIFEKRMRDEVWPLSSMDILPTAQAIFWLKNLNK